MLTHVTVGTNDIAKARAFYDEIMAMAGASPLMKAENATGYGRSFDEPMVVVTKPHDGNPASAGNGSMVSLRCASPEEVDKIYEKAMALGAKSEGGPGPRGPQFYGAYFRDPDGNKLAVFHVKPAQES
jgi:catechol 2,3-dioxygenase-like lactoylglutathione lyase family enzyme